MHLWLLQRARRKIRGNMTSVFKICHAVQHGSCSYHWWMMFWRMSLLFLSLLLNRNGNIMTVLEWHSIIDCNHWLSLEYKSSSKWRKAFCENQLLVCNWQERLLSVPKDHILLDFIYVTGPEQAGPQKHWVDCLKKALRFRGAFRTELHNHHRDPILEYF